MLVQAFRGQHNPTSPWWKFPSRKPNSWVYAPSKYPVYLPNWPFYVPSANEVIDDNPFRVHLPSVFEDMHLQ